jgi:hypothetical protein
VKNLLASSLAVFLLSGCAGYHLGSVKPHYLSDVHSIAVPTFKNNTLVPRVEVLVTDTVIKELQADGTFRIASGNENADATLKAEVVRVGRSPARSVRGNVLATVEFNLATVVRYSLVGRNNQPLGSGEVVGSTSFFVSSDVTTDERQALPLAAEQVAKSLVSQIAEGW